MADTLKRKLTFSAWADGAQGEAFDLAAAAQTILDLDEKDIVLRHDDSLTAVEVVGAVAEDEPVTMRLLALHDADNAPSSWGPGEEPAQVDFGDGHYSAFFTNVVIWPDKVIGHDLHANAPGLGRLADYIRALTDERVIFRALYEQGLEDQLSDLEGVRAVEYGIHRPHKRQQAEKTGLFGTLLPARPDVPSFRVSMSMGRKSKRDAYLPSDVVDDVIGLADTAEQFFDALVVRGHSKTEKTAAGGPKLVTINLLSKRLHVPADLPRDSENRSTVEQRAALDALLEAREQLDAENKIADAVEARLLLDQQP